MLELHCHTTCSDGSLTPTELVRAAAKAGVKALAISDHDTLAGWDEAFVAGDEAEVEIVPALELSTTWQGHSLHILGFYPDRALLTDPLDQRRLGRIRRAHQIVEKLAGLGYPIEFPAGHLAPGRPHIAQALMAAGHVGSYREAFDRLLYDHGPAYVAYEALSAVDGIRLLRRCGAVPVWAHPSLFRGGGMESVLPSLVEAGLMGIEAFHPEQDRGVTRRIVKLASQYDLLLTGGSDYHGPSHGRELNELNLGLSLLDDLKLAHAKLQAA